MLQACSIKNCCRSVASLKGEDFQENHIVQIFQILQKFFNRIEENKTKHGFVFKSQVCMIKFTVHICKCAANEFILLRNAFKKTHDPLTQIQNVINRCLWNCFKNTYSDIAQENKVADMFSKMLQNWIKQTVLRDMGRLIADKVITDDPAFQTKQTFINRVLTDLSQKRRFQSIYAIYTKWRDVSTQQNI